MGRPSKFKEEYIEQAEKLCKLGLIDTELAEFFEVTEKTLNNWKNEHPEFLQALKEGKLIADAAVSQSLFRRATGYSHDAVKIMQYEGVPVIEEFTQHYPPETAACIFWLSNRQPGRWRRNPDPNSGDDDLPPTKVVFEVVDARQR